MIRNNDFNPHQNPLFTDLYQLTMMQAYYGEKTTETAAFELFFRQLPAHRNYIVAAGLDDVLHFLESLRFSPEDIAWLRGLNKFSEGFLNRLQDFRFTGEVYAMPEGTPVFENEPVAQVIAPLPEAQLVETYLINQIHFQSVAASKAARVISAAQGCTVVDFGSRRSHGTDAALKTARSSYLVGAAGTSNVAAGRLYHIPVFGTMAHSYIQAHTDETAAFAAFAQEFPETTLLVDTYDTLAGVHKVIELANQLGDAFKVSAIRLDSGDLAELAKASRRLLDDAGLNRVKIIASSSLDEYKIEKLLAQNAPIDSFGVGTELAVSGDAPDIDFAYKLVEYAGQPRMKLSSSKVNRPGRKQVFRRFEEGRMTGDVIARFDEKIAGKALLQPVMKNGQRLKAGQVSLESARCYAQNQLQMLPPSLTDLQGADPSYSVAISAELEKTTAALQDSLQQRMIDQ